MELSTEAKIPFPPGKVFAACRDDVVALGRSLHGIRSVEIKSREERDDTVDLIVEWRAGGHIPSVLRTLMGGDVFDWTDHSSWDRTSLTVDWRSELRAFWGAVSCGARDTFVEDGPGSTLLRVRGALDVDAAKLRGVPGPLRSVVARRLEPYLLDQMLASVDRMGKALSEHLRQKHI